MPDQRSRSTPRTVIRPRGQRSTPDFRRLERIAAPVLALARDLREAEVRDVRQILSAAAERLDRVERDAGAAGMKPVSITPLRYGLVVVLDAHVRANRDIPLDAWSAGLPRLFDGRSVSLAGLRDLNDKARRAGPDYADLAEMLSHLIDTAESAHRQPEPSSLGRRVIIAAIPLLLLAGLTTALWADWRHQREVWAAFESTTAALPMEPDRALPVLARALDRYRATAEQAREAAAEAPVGLLGLIGALDPGTRAWSAYRQAVARTMPPHLFAATDAALATEGDGRDAYDTLRSHAILTGAAPWQPGWLIAWAQAREGLVPGLAAAAPHITALDGPPAEIPPTDNALLAQAREFAAEVSEAERAFLELVRSDPARALPPWRPTEAIPGLDTVLVRRSGTPLSEPIPGIYTTAGWAHAQQIGAGVAVQAARDRAEAVLGTAPRRDNDSPDAVIDILQRRTLATWSQFVSDLRVRPFTEPESALVISAALSHRGSPLERLLRAVWEQTGGTDRKRDHANQLAIATEFGPMIQFVEQGRMANIANLFATLNVALGTLDANKEKALDRLMSVQERATSIAALQQAPTVVVQIVEDVLAQTATAHDEVLQNPLSRLWRTEVAETCAAVTAAAYPFAPGPDASVADFAKLFGPGGTLDRFFRLRLAHLIDTQVSPWRWKPEAALAGFDQDSAAFFQRVAALRAAFFGADGTLAAPLTLTTLAERGAASISLGGRSVPVRATGEPESLEWPGPRPAEGVRFTARTEEGEAEVSHAGPWGLFRLLDPLRLRERDEGARFLVDLRLKNSRFFLELQFEGPVNPVAYRSQLSKLTCPARL